MSNAFLAEFAVDMHEAMLQAGIADIGTFGAPHTAAVPCRLYLDRNVASLALGGVEIQRGTVVVRLLKDGIAGVPKSGDRITVGAEVFTVARRESEDEAEWVLLCQA